MDTTNRFLKQSAKHLHRTAFLTVYPFFMFIQNFSFFFTLAYISSLQRLSISKMRINSVMSILAVMLMIGAACSTIGAGIYEGLEMFSNSVIILPNYIYWAILIIILGNTALVVTTLFDLYRLFFWGIVCAIISYYFLTPLYGIVPFFRGLSPNSFAFILILFAPMGTAYIQQKKKNGFITALFIISVTVAGFLSGSRTGSLLAVSGCIMTLALDNWIRMIIIGFFSLFMIVVAPEILDSPAVKSSIFKMNERTYELIYSTDETLATDRSFLTRLAMVEKGINIFKESPISGVGVNNFTRTEGEIDFNFEGAEFIEGKAEQLTEGISAHNSYVSFLAEGGLLLFIPCLLLIFFPTFYFIINFNRIKGFEKAIFVSIMFMSIHAWFISAMLNVFGWFVLGLVNSYIINKRVILLPK